MIQSDLHISSIEKGKKFIIVIKVRARKNWSGWKEIRISVAKKKIRGREEGRF